MNFVVVQNLNWIIRFEVYAIFNAHFVLQDAIIEQWAPGAIFVPFKAHNRWCG